MELLLIKPMFAQVAIKYAFKAATPEGKITIYALAVVSMLSWTVIITKARQLWRARKVAKKFFAAYRSTRDPLDLYRAKQEFDGTPAYEVYFIGAEELNYHLTNNPVQSNDKPKISRAAFDFVRVAMERIVSAEGMGLEKGMIVLSTAVAGGPFIGLLGTVWGVMETFSGVAKANAATLTAMAPGVAGALIATVIGLLVAIPAMFAYNFMVTQVRGITQQLDDFASEFSTQLDHTYVDPRSDSHEYSVTPGVRASSDEDLKSSPNTTHLARASLTGS
jgi:biopolymer transport protein ExbB/TolQ